MQKIRKFDKILQNEKNQLVLNQLQVMLGKDGALNIYRSHFLRKVKCCISTCFACGLCVRGARSKPSLRAYTAQDILLRAHVSFNFFSNAFILKIHKNKNKYFLKIISFY